MTTTMPGVSARLGASSRWLVSIVATIASAYALDLVATAAGVLLVGTGLFTGVDLRALLVVLVLSYLAWAGGLRTGLAGNAQLLERTGTSTNVVSKAAFDLARRRSPRMRRLAGSAGYVLTEVAKELPYYVGAFGASGLSEAVSTSDAVVFLAGANLGAAIYEMALGRGTLALLRPRDADRDR